MCCFRLACCHPRALPCNSLLTGPCVVILVPHTPICYKVTFSKYGSNHVSPLVSLSRPQFLLALDKQKPSADPWAVHGRPPPCGPPAPASRAPRPAPPLADHTHTRPPLRGVARVPRTRCPAPAPLPPLNQPCGQSTRARKSVSVSLTLCPVQHM